MSDFQTLVNDTVESIFDEGVKAGLNLAIRMCDASIEAGYQADTIKSVLERLRDNPPGKGPE